ncbi:RHS repeat-associated core domain-containing protein [Hymenobacter elongatus]|uniref:RHS repeat-associated core domain-containing protein n=1 Tax=Hymenobacter elongatus TaxID=877208 RepID=A0A4Z0PE32_9BACT|nr:hypothetical protein [Hymenobacter elongatus]TGE11910.1 hypothetical protein E5J99_20610 [Hymenobacter elongatus]
MHPFLAVDPLAGEYSNNSPFNFAGNDPINYNDPNGDEQTKINGRLANPRGMDGKRHMDEDMGFLDKQQYQSFMKGFEVAGITLNPQLYNAFDKSVTYNGNTYKLYEGYVSAGDKNNMYYNSYLSSETTESKFGIGEWGLTSTLTQGWFDKNAALIMHIAQEEPTVLRVGGRVLGVAGTLLGGISAAYEIQSKGLTFVTGTKAVLGIGLGVAGVIIGGPTLAVVGFAYGIADYYGGVDYVLNGTVEQAEIVNSVYHNGVRQWSNWKPGF